MYWRYEMKIRALESARASVTAGNGAIYAVRRSDYLELGAAMSHDLAFPFTLVKRGPAERSRPVPPTRPSGWCRPSKASSRASAA